MLNGYSINETRIRKMESSIQELIEANKLREEDSKTIKDLLLKLIDRPVIFQNHFHTENQIKIGSEKLEEKLISLIDTLIASAKVEEVKTQLVSIKNEVKKEGKSKKALQKITGFSLCNWRR